MIVRQKLISLGKEIKIIQSAELKEKRLNTAKQIQSAYEG